MNPIDYFLNYEDDMWKVIFLYSFFFIAAIILLFVLTNLMMKIIKGIKN